LQFETPSHTSFLDPIVAIYHQRASAERINSQAQALGIERPHVRNGRSAANLNTLIYLVINARVLAKTKSINRGFLQMN
jgi:hypothetical protein